MRERCDCKAIKLEIEDLTTAKITCPVHGSSYLFRRENGQWETEVERRERLKLVRVCEDCDKEYTLATKQYQANTARQFCNACAERRQLNSQRTYDREKTANVVHRGSAGAKSPWFARRQARVGA